MSSPFISVNRRNFRATSPDSVTKPSGLKESMYASLPRTMKSEVLVKTKVEDPEVMEQRRQLAQSKSVGELAKVSGLSDFPVPSPIENLLHGKVKKEEPKER